MQWTDHGILLLVTPLGEESLRIGAFTEKHGLHFGSLRRTKKQETRGMLTPGNLLNITWKARLSEHLGHMQAELIRAHAALLFQHPARLAALSSMVSLLLATLSERDPHPELYKRTLQTLHALVHDTDWPIAYLQFELELLASIGFGLDLSSCAVTGSKEGLRYISPKSGHAVSEEGAGPYLSKLFPLPSFLLTHTIPTLGPTLGPTQDELLAAYGLTEHFLARYFSQERGKTIPAQRDQLIEALERSLVTKREASLFPL